MSLILIAENSLSMAKAEAQKLAAFGHECLIAQNFSEALSIFQESPPALVLTESYLGDGHGLDLARQLLQLKSKAPIIMATALGNEELAAEFFSLGGFAYILKTPDYLVKLPQIVENALNRKTEQAKRQEKNMQTRRLEAQNELSAWLAHNFKNILAASLGSLQLINLQNDGQSKEKQIEYLADSQDSLKKALQLLEQLEEMTQGGAGEAEKLIVAEEVDGAWERVRRKLLNAAKSKGENEERAMENFFEQLAFLNATRSLPPQFMVRRDLASILEAVLQNAVEAVMQVEQARILVRGEIKDGKLEIIVRDNGRGMNEQVLQHALEPLFSTKGEVGVGLSLSLVQSLLTRHGGAVELKSVPNQGCTALMTWADI